ncbi:MFS transporter [Micromonospora sp. NPDC049559]|uniref:MFS transporter n=1 Tax=Micromonospora sp. NPDC049559 TaxID=3155923 RepID=UPI0034376EC5
MGGAYWRLWTAAVVSRFGDAVRAPALALLAASLSRDPRTVAVVVVAGQLPPLLFGLLGGVWADRWDRRRTMAAIDGARALLVAGFAVLLATGYAGVAALVACAFALATLGTLFDASAFALLPSVVPAERLAAANGRLQAGTSVAGGFLGAPVAGVLFAAAAALPFAVDAASFAIAALLALTLGRAAPAGAARGAVPATPVDTPAGPVAATPAGAARGAATPARAGGRPARGGIWREAAEGLRWIGHDPTLRLLTGLTAATNLAISGVIAVVVLYALDVLRVPAPAYGLFMSAAVAGGLLGGLGAGRLAGRFGTLPGLRVVLVAQTLALGTLALARQPVPGAVALAVFAAGTAAWNALWSAYGQRNVPAELLGRVGAAQRTVGLLAAPAGALLAGFGADAYGLPAVVGAAATVFALVTAASWRVLRHRREQPAPLAPPTAPQAEPAAREDGLATAERGEPAGS